ncbi:HET-domain-containing protein [Trematosphaeria pertusa]|uniref:HET-domain-containing protein n=1 Tax=Trematosphaeria pertusa TaxID=390896 RepID=A0A6A6IAD8_9PLEO|nr:HET-domain-containing protein [Trematosphaeria pertusa]KAF2246892.1 HET-domain-containing protein [Trematosphaeria pertusa]
MSCASSNPVRRKVSFWGGEPCAFPRLDQRPRSTNSSLPLLIIVLILWFTTPAVAMWSTSTALFASKRGTGSRLRIPTSLDSPNERQIHSGLYKPLQQGEIRVLRLYPGIGDEPVRCSLELVYLDAESPPEYNALSYEWGRPDTEDYIIQINDFSVPVRKNLYFALLSIRGKSADESTTMTIWIDAVCINQKDIRERNAQVGMMGSIYAGAATVVVWLGPASEDSDAAFDFIHCAFRSHNWSAKDASPDDPGLRAFTKLPDRSYWSRLWIIQEFVLAKEIVLWCGCKQIDWEKFSLARNLVLKLTPNLRSKIGSLGPCDQIRKLDKHEITLERLLSETCDSLCENPHDKIFGLLGLLPTFESGVTGVPSQGGSGELPVGLYEGKKRDILMKTGTMNVERFPVDYGMSSFELYWSVIRYHWKESGEAARILWDFTPNSWQLRIPPRIMWFSQMVQRSLSIDPCLTYLYWDDILRNNPLPSRPFQAGETAGCAPRGKLAAELKGSALLLARVHGAKIWRNGLVICAHAWTRARFHAREG